MFVLISENVNVLNVSPDTLSTKVVVFKKLPDVSKVVILPSRDKR